MLRSPLSLHALAGLAALSAVGVLAASSFPRHSGADVTSGEPALLIVDHSAPLSVELTVTISKKRMLVEVDPDSGEPVTITVPDHWLRTEVRRAQLGEITGQPASFGVRAYRLPPRAGISFAAPSPGGLTVRNPSTAPLKIQWTGINLDIEDVVKDVMLVQEGEKKVW